MGGMIIAVGGGSSGSGRVFAVELAAEGGGEGGKKLLGLAGGARQWMMDLGEEV